MREIADIIADSSFFVRVPIVLETRIDTRAKNALGHGTNGLRTVLSQRRTRARVSIAMI